MKGQDTPKRLANARKVLDDLLAQAEAYMRILADDGRAQTAVAALRELARAARNEVADVEAAMAEATPPSDPLSPRERQVLEAVARGLSNKQIAYALAISERTVQFHLNGVFNKTGAGSRTEAVVVAIRNGWIETP